MIRADEWLAGVLARPVFAVVPEAAVGDPGEELRAHAVGRSGALYFARVPTADVAVVHALEAAGMRTVDVNVTFGRPGAPGLPAAAAGAAAVAVAPLTPGDPPADAAAVLDIAETCFRYSRFHLDPAIPKALAGKVKREWIANYVRRARGLELLVARRDGVPVGFLAVIKVGAEPRSPRAIDLVGVSGAAQRSGAGSALVRAFVERHGPSCDELRVGTQAANLPSLAFYERNGFTVVQTSYVLHMHAEGAP